MVPIRTAQFTWYVRVRRDRLSRSANSNPPNEYDARPVLKDRPADRFNVIPASGVCLGRQGSLQALPDTKQTLSSESPRTKRGITGRT